MHAIADLLFSQENSSASSIIMVLGALFWTLTYIFGIRLGFKEKTYAIPMFALMLNFSWEVYYSFGFLITDLGSGKGLSSTMLINIMWSCFDAVIIFTFLRYGKKYFPTSLSSWFYPNFILAIALAFIFQHTSYHYFSLPDIPYPSGMTAYLMNLLMSILFIMMLFRRKSSEGQSVYLAFSKFLGTGLTSLALIINPHAGLWGRAGFIVYFLVAACFIYDVIYIILLYRQFKLEGKNPWKLP